MSGSSEAVGNEATEYVASDQKAIAFIVIFAVSLAIGVILLLLLSVLRTRIPNVFQLRALLSTWDTYVNYNGSRVGVIEPVPDGSFFGWVKPMFTVPEDEVLCKIGLDAVMFFRFIRTAFYISALISIFGVVILMPVYGTGDLHKKDDNIDPLHVVSLANLGPRNSRFWATVVAEVFTTAVVVVFMARDLKHFANLRRQYRISDNPANYAILVYDIPKNSQSESAIRERFKCLVPEQVLSVLLIRNPLPSLKLIKKLDTAVRKRETAEYDSANKNKEMMMRPGLCGSLMFFRPKVNANEYWVDEQERITEKLREQTTIAEPTPAAIVVLKNKHAASLLFQVNSRTNATNWHVERAPEPQAVHWPTFRISGYQAEIRTIAVAVFIFFFTLMWTGPSLFIIELSKVLGSVEGTDFTLIEKGEIDIGWNDFLLAFIEVWLPSFILSSMLKVVPNLFKFVVGFERISSLPHIEAKTRDYFYIFTIYGSFFVILIGASLLYNEDVRRGNFTSIIDKLALAVSRISVNFAGFIVVHSLVPFLLTLSGVSRVVIRWIKLNCFAKTERSRRRARSGGSTFSYLQHYALGMLIFFLCLAFSSFAPLVPIFATLHFGLSYVCFRYVIMYMTYNSWDGGGELFPGTYWGTMLALILKQVITIFVLALKQEAVQSAICIIPLIVTLCFTFILSHRYERVAKYGSIIDLYEEEKSKTDQDKLDELLERYKTVYQQPAGMVKSYENLNGIKDNTVMYSKAEACDGTDECGVAHLGISSTISLDISSAAVENEIK